jgi:hypothetical protein
MVSRFLINYVTYLPTAFPQYIRDCADAAASDLHENWRKEYIAKNGDVPRYKDTPEGQVDINVPYEQVHPMYQEANFKMAHFTMNMIRAFHNEKDRRVLYRLIHDFWLQENAYARGGPLDKPWDELPQVEQDKDVVVFDVCMKHYLADSFLSHNTDCL